MPWYAIACATHFEDKIAQKIGTRAYIPRRIVWRKVSRGTRGRVKRSYPLIPGYVLVSMDLRDSVYDLLRVERHVFGFVSIAGQPLTIRDNEIQYIKSREALGHYDETKGILLKLIGGQFEVFDGVMAGRKAKVVSIKNRDLMMEVDGFPLPVTISIDSFERTRHTRVG